MKDFSLCSLFMVDHGSFMKPNVESRRRSHARKSSAFIASLPSGDAIRSMCPRARSVAAMARELMTHINCLRVFQCSSHVTNGGPYNGVASPGMPGPYFDDGCAAIPLILGAEQSFMGKPLKLFLSLK